MSLGASMESFHPHGPQSRSPGHEPSHGHEAHEPQVGPSWRDDSLSKSPKDHEPQPQSPEIATHSHSTCLPQQHEHPQPGSPDPLEEVPLAAEFNIRGERRRLRGQRRVRPDGHSTRMEELGIRHFNEAKKHNQRVEELLQQRNQITEEHNSRLHEREVEKVAILRELLEEYRRRGPPPQ